VKREFCEVAKQILSGDSLRRRTLRSQSWCSLSLMLARSLLQYKENCTRARVYLHPISSTCIECPGTVRRSVSPTPSIVVATGTIFFGSAIELVSSLVFAFNVISVARFPMCPAL